MVHVLGQIFYLILSKLTIPKYSNPSSLVEIIIKGVKISNVLVDLVVAINVMTKDLMSQLSISNIRTTPIVLQLVDSSTIKLDGVVEDV